MVKDKAAYSIELEKSMHAFLQEMVKKYKLPNVGKAVRCLVTYARTRQDQQDAIFGEIRCPDC